MPAHAHTLLQISDLHLLPHPGDTLYGVDTEDSFHRVLDYALAAHPKIDLILVTGDLTQEPLLASYRRIADKLQTTGIACICLPGNHDEPALMHSTLNGGRISCDKQAFLDNWQIIALNSLIPGKPAGRLDKQELRFLEGCLRAYPDRYALIAVHHHCQKIGSLWMDAMMIENSEELLAVLRRYPKVRAVTCGHIHQVMDKQADGLRIFSAPSTCFQFEPESIEFSLDDTGAGYRIIDLYQDGSMETDVYRLSGNPGGFRHKAELY